jgi:NAD(P)-dependent dehydrogenase (short-subunit alcohol dehydrogenase family)
MLSYLSANTTGPQLFFQTYFPWIGAKDEGSERNAKYVFVSNVVGSIEAQAFVPLDLMLYSVSKAGCSLLARKNRLQHKELIVFAVHPGWVRTEMGNWR